jgi:pimeloyl-ACP methyl ester carboxylesterase
MLESIGKRELIVLDGLGVRLRGTYHRPADWAFDSTAGDSTAGDSTAGDSTAGDSAASRMNRTGVLFVNSLSLPRAASGDSAVYWADSIAEHGYPAFRIDLPGLGDSEGEASPDLLDTISAGGLATVAAGAAKQLVQRFGLTGIVIFGHCAGAVSALFAGAAGIECEGLILLDPYFHLPRAKRPKVRQELSDWARRSRVGAFLSNGYDRARKLRLLLRGSALPANANSALLARWKQVASSGLPILILKAPGIKAQGSKPRVGEFDYIDYAVKLAGRKSRVSVDFVEGADHSFANRAGREAVERLIAGWLAARFPLTNFSLSATENSLSRAGKNQSESRQLQEAPADLGCALEGR